jgi:hypothetical protein
MTPLNLILKALAKIVNQMSAMQSALNNIKEMTEMNADAIDTLIQIETKRQETNKNGRR